MSAARRCRSVPSLWSWALALLTLGTAASPLVGLQDASGWRLSAEPTASIGVLDGAPEYLLDRTTDVAILPGDRVGIVELGSAEVRVYDRMGRHEFSFGSRGQGPGEVRQPLGIHPLRGDSLAVEDRRERVHLFSLEGTHGRTVTWGITPMEVDPVTLHTTTSLGRLVGFFADGSFLVETEDEVELGEENMYTVAQTPDRVAWRVSPSGRDSTEVVRIPGRHRDLHESNLILPVVFGPDVHIELWQDAIIVADARAGEIHWYDREGRRYQSASRDWPITRVTGDMVQGHLQRSAPPLIPEIVRARSFASTLAPFSAMLVDAEGNVWLRHSRPEDWDTRMHYIRTPAPASSWSVFGRTGMFLGEVDVPAGFTPVAIGTNQVWGVSRDEYDVERVEGYDLIR